MVQLHPRLTVLFIHPDAPSLLGGGWKKQAHFVQAPSLLVVRQPWTPPAGLLVGGFFTLLKPGIQMAPKVIGKDKAKIQKITCNGCAAIVSYVPNDVSHQPDGDDTYSFITCPGCSKRITVRS